MWLSTRILIKYRIFHIENSKNFHTDYFEVITKSELIVILKLKIHQLEFLSVFLDKFVDKATVMNSKQKKLQFHTLE